MSPHIRARFRAILAKVDVAVAQEEAYRDELRAREPKPKKRGRHARPKESDE